MKLTPRLRNESRRIGGRRGQERLQTLRDAGLVKKPTRRPQTWKRRQEPEVLPVRTRTLPCAGVPDAGRYEGYDCNAKRIVQSGVGNPGIRCRECTVCAVYRSGLSRWEPEVVIAILKKLIRTKKIGRAAKRPPATEGSKE